MSPLVYKRRAHKKVQPSAIKGVLSWSKAIVQAPVASSIAFAFVLFAAGSVGAMTLVAQTEIGSGDYTAPQMAMYRTIDSQFESAVLGERTELSVMPIFQMGNASSVPPTLSFSVTAVPETNGTSTKDVGYTVQYNLAGFITPSSTLSVGINGKVQAKNLPSSGSVSVKVKPGANEVVFSSKTGSKTQKVLSFMVMGVKPVVVNKQLEEAKNWILEHCKNGSCFGNSSSTLPNASSTIPKFN